MIPKIQVEFCITGTQLSPNKITDLLGISPTRTWQIGESIQGTNLRRKHNGWCLSTELEDDLDLARQARFLLQILLLKSERINQICNKYELDCEVSCTTYIVDQAPIINFDQDIISGFSKLKATVDIDIIVTK